VAPNVMDVSEPHGVVCGEAFPGGRLYFRASGHKRGAFLGATPGAAADARPDVPQIPEAWEGVSAVWLAKSSSAVPSMTGAMVGIMSAATLGVVSAWTLGHRRGPAASRYARGELTVRWALCPGVPIVALGVDDGYNQRRKAAGRVWAVALNALGEVYYLKE